MLHFRINIQLFFNEFEWVCYRLLTRFSKNTSVHSRVVRSDLSYTHVSVCTVRRWCRLVSSTHILESSNSHFEPCALWHFRLWSFQGRDTKLEKFSAKNQLYSNEITKFWELGIILVINGFKNWFYQKMLITTNVLLNWNSSMKKNSERFQWFLT